MKPPDYTLLLPAPPRASLPPPCLQTIYHNPKETTIAVVTVGGICPGLNDVVRSIVHKVGGCCWCLVVPG
jgi:6-phosphofructokinase 1